MSRADLSYGNDEEFPGQFALWEQSQKQALKSKRGRQVLRDLRAALLALSDKRIISRALCTVGRHRTNVDPDLDEHLDELLNKQGEGVCIVGAYAWHQLVRMGKTTEEAFDALPTLLDIEHPLYDTINFAKTQCGMSIALAWMLSWKNDETLSQLLPEDRYTAFMRWIDAEIAQVEIG
mgnify:CR=1 FL=1